MDLHGRRLLPLLALLVACGDNEGDGDSGPGGDGGDGPPLPEVGAVCEGIDARDVSSADATISGDDCNEDAIRSAVEAGGTIVIDCADPVVFSRQIEVRNDVVIDGSGTTILDGGGVTRLITKFPGPDLHLQNIEFQNGQAPDALGDPNATQANWFEWAGGAINLQCHDDGYDIGGFVSAKNISCHDNATGSHSYDPQADQILDSGNGGCIYSFLCELQCDECDIRDNWATSGGGIGSLGGKTLLVNSSCVGNEARFNPEANNVNQGCGGCYCQDGTELNHGDDSENWVHFCGNVIANNRADDSGGGVSIFYRQGTNTSVRFEKNSCQGNHSGEREAMDTVGGCFYVYVDPDTRSEWAPDEGPDTFVFAGNAVYDNSTWQAGGGAAIYNIWDTGVRFENNLFLRNEVRTTDQASGGGGGLSLVGTWFDVEHNTFVDNVANNWTGGLAQGAGGSALRNNIFVNNQAPPPGGDGSLSPAEHVTFYFDEVDDGEDDGILVFASGGNLYLPVRAPNGPEGATPGAAVLDEDPMLGELVIDDTFPPYLPLEGGSPAIDSGIVTEAVSLDMRGMPRDDAPDIGAYEAMR